VGVNNKREDAQAVVRIHFVSTGAGSMQTAEAEISGYCRKD